MASVAGTMAMSSCLRFQPFECESDESCERSGTLGICRTGYCAFPDDGCESNYRYEDYAGQSFGGDCVIDEVAEGTAAATGELPGETGPSTSADASTESSGVSESNGDESSAGSTGSVPCGRAGQTCCDDGPCDPGLACMDGRCGCVTSVAVGRRHACASQVDGSVWCWGDNAAGQVGLPNEPYATRPVRVDALPSASTLVLSAANHTCASLGLGDIWCWGDNAFAQAVPTLALPIAPPTLVLASGDAAWLVAATTFSCVGSSTAGTFATCFGSNAANQLTSAAVMPGPTAIATEFAFERVALGASHGCAISMDGSLHCWGANESGQQGIDPISIPTVATLTPIALASVADVVAGDAHTCAIASGQVHCFGLGTSGQLGNGTNVGTADPSTTALLPSDFTPERLVAGPVQTCALQADGRALCWGSNQNGQLLLTPDASGQDAFALAPQPIPPLEALAVAELGIGETHACARTRYGDVYCWGSNERGQVGDGSTAYAFEPTAVDTMCP